MTRPAQNVIDSARSAQSARNAGESARRTLEGHKPALMRWFGGTAANRAEVLDAAQLAEDSTDLDILQGALRFVRRSLAAGV